MIPRIIIMSEMYILYIIQLQIKRKIISFSKLENLRFLYSMAYQPF